jgi:nucleotide-binding universal stress UspA family protein
MKILVATDGSECGNAAVIEVANRPWPAGSEAKLLMAIELPLVPTPELWAVPEGYYTDYENMERDRAAKILEEAAATVRHKQEDALKVTTQISLGSAKNVVVEEADEWGADLIMVGSHGYSGLQRFLIGSVSQAVALHARCSVEIVRAAAADKQMAQGT